MSQSGYKSKLAQARQQRVIALIQALPVMPTAIYVPARIMQLYRSPKAPPMDAFADVLLADASLSSKVLELANSAWFGPPKPITRISEALRRIGLSNVLPLLFGLSLAGIFNKADLSAEERKALWQTSLLKGIFAREWVKWRKIDLQEEAFLCGVLQDIALPAMISADRSASPELLGVIDLSDNVRAEREALLYGADHAGFGGRVCNLLNLPEPYGQATATHHAPRGPVLPDEYRAMAPALQIASCVPHAMTRLDEHGAKYLCDCFSRVSGNDKSEEFVEFIKQATTAGQAMMAVLCPSHRSATGMKDFLYEVSDQIARTMFSAVGASNQKIEKLQADQTELEEKVRELNEQIVRADYDPLTNLLNRRGFIDRADKLIAMARKLHMGCAVGQIELPGLHEMVEPHGEAAGNQGLVACAESLRQMMQNRGMVGRLTDAATREPEAFGFVLIVPAEYGRDAVGGEVEQAIGGLSVTVGEVKIPVRSRVGIAWLAVPGADQNILGALKRAENQPHQVRQAA